MPRSGGLMAILLFVISVLAAVIWRIVWEILNEN